MRSRAARDALFLGAAALILLLAILGLISGIAFLTGASLSPSGSSPSSHTSGAAGQALLAKAKAEATEIVTQARSRSARIVATARAQATHIKHSGHKHHGPKNHGHNGSKHGGSKHHGHHGPHHRVHPPKTTLVPVATAPPATYPPTSTSSIPNIPGISPADIIVWFNFNPATDTVTVANRSTSAFRARLVVNYYTSAGLLTGTRSTYFVLGGKVVRVVSAGIPPPRYSRATVYVTDIRRSR